MRMKMMVDGKLWMRRMVMVTMGMVMMKHDGDKAHMSMGMVMVKHDGRSDNEDDCDGK